MNYTNDEWLKAKRMYETYKSHKLEGDALGMIVRFEHKEKDYQLGWVKVAQIKFDGELK